jgi:hypothetical protein
VSRRQTCWAAALLLAAAPASADEPRAKDAAEVKALATKIDGHLAARWRAARVRPAAPADDAAFLRRVYLDLAGHVPPVTDARDFLDDDRPDKRARLVERLLLGDDHAHHFAVV